MTRLMQLPQEERPRERFLMEGGGALSLTELLAICLGSGRKGRSVLQVAEELLAHCGSLDGVCSASIESLMSIKGVGKAKAVQIKATCELARKMTYCGFRERYPVYSPDDLFLYIAPKVAHYKKECVYLLLRDSKGFLFYDELFGVGTLNQVIIHPREVFRIAMAHQGASVVIVHNHPSGDPTPSTADIAVTKLLVEAGRMMGIPLDDHLIVSRNDYVSMWKKGFILERCFYR